MNKDYYYYIVDRTNNLQPQMCSQLMINSQHSIAVNTN